VNPTPNKLITMFRCGRPVHQVPQALRTLDRFMQPVANEQQEAATLAKAHETLLANPGQPSPPGSVSVSRPKPTGARKPSTSPSVSSQATGPRNHPSVALMSSWMIRVFGQAITAVAISIAVVALVAIGPLIVWAPREAATTSILPLGFLAIYQLTRLFLSRFIAAIHKGRSESELELRVSKRAPIPQRTDRPRRIAE